MLQRVCIRRLRRPVFKRRCSSPSIRGTIMEMHHLEQHTTDEREN
jgi:hypothetical protein